MDVATAVSKSSSAARALRLLRKQHGKETYDWLRRRIAEDNIDTSHWNTDRKVTKTVMADLCADGVKSRNQIRRLLIRENLCPYVCAECGLVPEWRGKPLVLRLDHINGIHYDHRLENLRFMCPNCDSQLETFAGRNTGNKRTPRVCADCGIGVSKNSTRCNACNTKIEYSRTRYNWPEHTALLTMIQTSSAKEVAVTLGLPVQAVRRRVSRVNHPPTRSYRKKTKTCEICGASLDSRSRTGVCRSHRIKRKSKIEWPSVDELISRTEASSFVAVAQELGVSDNAIRKRIRTRVPV